MTQQLTIAQVEQRIHRHTFIDGILELLMGGWLLALAGYYRLETTTNISIIFLYLLLMPSLPLLLGPVSRWIKRHVTDPRVGYVKYPIKTTQQRRMSAIIAGVIGILFGAAIGYVWASTNNDSTAYTLAGLFNWVPLIISLIFAVSFLLGAVRYAIPRFLVIGALLFAVGLTATLLPLALTAQVMVVMAFSGGVLFLSGLITFVVFLRRYPVVDLEIPAPDDLDQGLGTEER